MTATFLITAGPTIEDLDPVRFISNRATGKLGVELVRAALQAGRRVIFVHGPIHETILDKLPHTAALKCVPVRSAAQMHAAVMKNIAVADVVIMNAAVADYTPVRNSAVKIKKTGQELTLRLKPTVDILAQLGRMRRQFVLVGFALETGSESSQLEEARRKLRAKNLDLIVLDTPAEMGAEIGTFTLLDTSGARAFSGISKRVLARKIVAYCIGHGRDA